MASTFLRHWDPLSVPSWHRGSLLHHHGILPWVDVQCTLFTDLCGLEGSGDVLDLTLEMISMLGQEKPGPPPLDEAVPSRLLVVAKQEQALASRSLSSRDVFLGFL